jgi:hypothetical protein
VLTDAHETSHIAVERGKSTARQNDIVAIDFGQAVHFHHAAAASGVDMAFQRDDSSAICSALRDQKLQLAEKFLRESRAVFANRDGYLNMNADPKPESPSLR